MPALETLDGSTLRAPTDGAVRPTPPKPPVVPPSPIPTPTPTPGLSVNLDDLVKKRYAGKTAADLAAAPLHALKGLSTAKAALLTQALGVTTIAELAGHILVRAATTIADRPHPSGGSR